MNRYYIEWSVRVPFGAAPETEGTASCCADSPEEAIQKAKQLGYLPAIITDTTILVCSTRTNILLKPRSI